ncbi:MAG TPA: hypothetical protein VG797_08775 [Phycisphaerales bacterium]|nr:hypothetical protein [Phycisphaerales bacterium]
MNFRTTGRIAALLLMTGVIGLVLIGVIRSKSNAPATNQPPPIAPPTAAVGGGIAGTNVSGSDPSAIHDLVAMGREGVWTRVNPQTGKLQYKLTWATLDPEDAGVITLGSPEAWIYFDDRALRLRAASARFLWPAREREPESGSLAGNIVADFMPIDDPARPPDAETQSLLTLRAETLAFQSRLGEMTVPGRLTATGAVSFAGEGLTLTVSDVDQRLRVLRLDKGEYLRYDPSRAETLTARRSSSPSGSSTQPASTEHHLDEYRANFSGDVRLASGARTLDASELVAFLRLTDGKLRDGAISDMRGSTPRPATSPTADPARSAKPGVAPADEIVLNWSGPLEIRLLRETPTELGADDIYVRAAAGTDRPASFEDADSRAKLQAGVMQLGLTSMSGSIVGDQRHPATVSIPNEAAVSVGRIDFDLLKGSGALVGEGSIRSAGSPTSVASSDEADRTIAWSSRADFRFDITTGPVGAGGVVIPIEAIFTDNVRADDTSGKARADSFRAIFTRVERANERPIAVLSRIALDGSAEVSSSDGGTVHADSINTLFKTDDRTNRARPILATANGNATAEREGESLAADLIESGFESDSSGKTRVGPVRAIKDVVITARDGVSIRAAELRGDQSTRLYDLIGQPLTITHRRDDSDSQLYAKLARFDANAGTLTVEGEGDGLFTQPRSDGSGIDRFAVNWQRGMTYDDASGRAECVGNVKVDARFGELDRSTGQGDRVTVEITPRSGAASAGEPGQRRLLRASIDGGDFAGKTNAPSEIELRRYAANSTEANPVLESLVYLSGPRTVILGQADHLETTGPGKLLIEDRRNLSSTPAPAPSESSTTTRGTTLFQWNDSLAWNRQSGEVRLTGGVRMDHLDPASNDRITLDAAELHAMLVPNKPGASGQSAQNDQASFRLTRATATGDIRASFKNLRITSNDLLYEPDANRVTVAANEPRAVTIIDGAAGRTVEAQSIEIDLLTGKWKVLKLRAGGSN